jgi:hypothetical protein
MFLGQVRLSAFEIRAEGSDFRISWTTELEEEVRQFEIMRRTPNSNDQFVRTGSGSGLCVPGFPSVQVRQRQARLSA